MALPKTKQGKRSKVKTVLSEFKEGELHSGSGQKVTNPKQALAIALSESGQSKPKTTRRPANRARARPPDVVTVHRS